MPSGSKAKGLPPGAGAGVSQFSAALDELIAPSVASGNRGNSDQATIHRLDGGTSDTQGTSGNEGTRDTLGTPSTSDPRVTSVTSSQPKAAPRQHLKLRTDLAQELRNAVWFLSEHGRPRVELGQLLDEAVETWLAEAKKVHNEGQDFPERGRLR